MELVIIANSRQLLYNNYIHVLITPNFQYPLMYYLEKLSLYIRNVVHLPLF